ncbi:hypothetical protein FRB98_008912 [Tulasnella sp. 332]|nr:hypothetical protein FRB98_008912 [Tulasnella sp. 332]
MTSHRLDHTWGEHKTSVVGSRNRPHDSQRKNPFSSLVDEDDDSEMQDNDRLVYSPHLFNIMTNHPFILTVTHVPIKKEYKLALEVMSQRPFESPYDRMIGVRHPGIAFKEDIVSVPRLMRSLEREENYSVPDSMQNSAPSGAFALVDCSDAIRSPAARFVFEGSLFLVVVAASPHSGTWDEWIKYEDPMEMFFMKLFTKKELLAAEACRYATDTRDYTALLETDIKGLKWDAIYRALYGYSTLSTGQGSHLVFPIQPEPNPDNRWRYLVPIASPAAIKMPYLYHKVGWWEKLDIESPATWKDAGRRTY